MKRKRLTKQVIIVFFAVFFFLMGVTAYIEYSHQYREREQMKYMASTVSAQTNEVLYARLSKAETLEALVIKNDGGTENFEQVARVLIAEGCVRNVLLAPDGVVSDVYPLKGNEKLIGNDLLGNEAEDESIQNSIAKGEMILEGPYTLEQGGIGFSGMLPVFHNGKYWGLVSVTLSYPEALGDMSAMRNLPSQGYGCAIWRINPSTGKRQTILSTGTGPKSISYETSFDVFNTNWNITVYPVEEWYVRGFLWLCVGLSFVLSAVIAAIVSGAQTIRAMDKEMIRCHIGEMEAQMERDRANVLLTQINSHFFYHTLNAIQALIVLEPSAAYKMTEDFSRLIRFKVDSVDVRHGLVSFKEEMRSVQAYADINEIQLGDRLQVEYDVFDADFMIPVLTIQPVVENAIVHGIKPKVGGGIVMVRLNRNGDFYEVVVEDDGVGFKPEEISSNTSVGISNVKTRMNQHQGCSINVESEPGLGTRVVLRYPTDLSKECEE